MIDDMGNSDRDDLKMNNFDEHKIQLANELRKANAIIATLEGKLQIAVEALEFAVQDVSTGHWEDDCKVPPTYEPCNHCYLKLSLAKLKGEGE